MVSCSAINSVLMVLQIQNGVVDPFQQTARKPVWAKQKVVSEAHSLKSLLYSVWPCGKFTQYQLWYQPKGYNQKLSALQMSDRIILNLRQHVFHH